VAGWDLDAREHLALWPMVALFLVMGVCSPIWLKAIDGAAVGMADRSATAAGLPDHTTKVEAETYQGGAR